MQEIRNSIPEFVETLLLLLWNFTESFVSAEGRLLIKLKCHGYRANKKAGA